MSKTFKLSADRIEPLAEGYGGCLATDMITVEGYPVRFMFRVPPHNEFDGGWRFSSGFESREYMSDPGNFSAFDVNTIANYDPSIVPFLDAPEGSAFEKAPGSEEFSAVAGRSRPGVDG